MDMKKALGRALRARPRYTYKCEQIVTVHLSA